MKPIEYSDRTILTKLFNNAKIDISSYNFTNLYMWRKYYNLAWSVNNNILYMSCQPNATDTSFRQPLLTALSNTDDWVVESIDYLVQYCLSNHILTLTITDANVDYAKVIQSTYPQFSIEHTRQYDDYVYLKSDLINLSGKSYHRKMNYIRSFKREYPNYSYQRINATNIDSCIQLLSAWIESYDRLILTTPSEKLPVHYEFESVIEVIQHLDRFDTVNTGVLLINNKVIALTLSEKLDDRTIVIHTEKADTELVKESYAVINQLHLINEYGSDNSIIYVNRECDLGIERLRKAKTSYNPHHMVETYSLYADISDLLR